MCAMDHAAACDLRILQILCEYVRIFANTVRIRCEYGANLCKSGAIFSNIVNVVHFLAPPDLSCHNHVGLWVRGLATSTATTAGLGPTPHTVRYSILSTTGVTVMLEVSLFEGNGASIY